MATGARRAAVCFDPLLHKALKLKAVEKSTFISGLVNKDIRKAPKKDLKTF